MKSLFFLSLDCPIFPQLLLVEPAEVTATQRSLPPLFASIWWILKCTTKAETKCPSHLLLNSLFLFPSQTPCLEHVFPFFIRTWQSTFLNIYRLSQIGDVHLVKEVAKCWKRIFLAAIPSFINFFNSIIIRLKGWRYHVRSAPQLGDTIPRYFKMKTLLVGLVINQRTFKNELSTMNICGPTPLDWGCRWSWRHGGPGSSHAIIKPSPTTKTLERKLK